MGSLSPIHWLIIAVIVLLLFGGKGKITGIMGDTAKGIKAFKDGLKDDEQKAADAKAAEAKAAAAPGALPRTDAEKEAIAREETKHSA
jgi:sec-independent protein translocase protein TatA